MIDLRPGTISDELAIHVPQIPGAYLLNDLCGMVDDEHRSCAVLRRSCVILFSLRSSNAASPVESASSMRRMFGFAAATITKRRCDDILDE